MKIFDYLATIDRRIIYLIIAIVVILPLVFPRPQRVRVMTPTQKLFEAVDSIPEEKVLLIDFDYDPQTAPENEPMAIALIRHAFKKRIKVAALSLYVQPLGLAVKALDQVREEFNARATTNEDSIIYGRDYVLLGWQPPPIVPLLGLGISISGVYPTDYYGYRTDSLPVMWGIRNLSNVGILVSVSGGSAPLWWVAYSQVRYGVMVAAGLTAVSASEFFIYYQTGQFSGLMVGMKGGAEYEEMVAQLDVPGRRRASEALGSLTAAHLTIIAFIIIGNIGYFVRRRRK
ncbi:hypothetical protein AMJ87_04360 [candidate division WOR_3 bacterium SM23_60]|uniref:Uncharacterized protein n=1 Tax=candidate division WOR_3 bacterium SM23_60 TaxID=1703780 RepID=A0A0S8GIG6_UNCW3|nr:MAG: hypothetical protein AMJ87_04360 [candidate division WOR_3 bacterium SM23_60]